MRYFRGLLVLLFFLKYVEAYTVSYDNDDPEHVVYLFVSDEIRSAYANSDNPYFCVKYKFANDEVKCWRSGFSKSEMLSSADNFELPYHVFGFTHKAINNGQFYAWRHQKDSGDDWHNVYNNYSGADGLDNAVSLSVAGSDAYYNNEEDGVQCEDGYEDDGSGECVCNGWEDTENHICHVCSNAGEYWDTSLQACSTCSESDAIQQQLVEDAISQACETEGYIRELEYNTATKFTVSGQSQTCSRDVSAKCVPGASGTTGTTTGTTTTENADGTTTTSTTQQNINLDTSPLEMRLDEVNNNLVKIGADTMDIDSKIQQLIDKDNTTDMSETNSKLGTVNDKLEQLINKDNTTDMSETNSKLGTVNDKLEQLINKDNTTDMTETNSKLDKLGDIDDKLQGILDKDNTTDMTETNTKLGDIDGKMGTVANGIDSMVGSLATVSDAAKSVKGVIDANISSSGLGEGVGDMVSEMHAGIGDMEKNVSWIVQSLPQVNNDLRATKETVFTKYTELYTAIKNKDAGMGGEEACVVFPSVTIAGHVLNPNEIVEDSGILDVFDKIRPIIVFFLTLFIYWFMVRAIFSEIVGREAEIDAELNELRRQQRRKR